MSINLFTRRPLAAAIALSVAPTLTFAAGYALNEQSASAMGTANAGAAANVENASIMYFNPAGIAFLKEAQVSGGLTYLDVRNEFSGSATNTIGQPVDGTPGGEYVAPAVIPNLYYSTPINDTFSAGIGFYAPYGVAGNYDDNFTGRFFADETELKVVSLQPTFAVRLHETLSVGLGAVISYAEGTLTKAQEYSAYTLPPNNIPSALLREGHFDVSGNDTAVGWTAGVYFQPNEDTSIGLNYRSRIDFDLEGDASLSNVPVATGDATNPIAYATLTENAELPLTTPESVTLSLKHAIGNDLTLLAGTTWTRWSQFQNLDIFTTEASGTGAISNIASAKFQGAGYIGHVPERWRNTWAFSVGAAYQLNPQTVLKAGYAYDESPIQAAYRTARVPATDRNWLTLGAQYTEFDWTVDAAVGYLIIKDVYVNEHEYTVAGSKIGASGLQAKYEMDAVGVALQVTKRF